MWLPGNIQGKHAHEAFLPDNGNIVITYKDQNDPSLKFVELCDLGSREERLAPSLLFIYLLAGESARVLFY
jgi:hypothetical protein